MTTPTEPQAAATPFPEALAPWTCKGEAFWFFGYFNPPKGYYPPQSAFSDLEGASNFIDPAVTGTYKGGLNTIMVVRYTETPVGTLKPICHFKSLTHKPYQVRTTS